MNIDRRYLDKTLSIEKRVENLIQQMTLKEKIGQVNQRLYGWKTICYQNGNFKITDFLKNELNKWGSIGSIYGVLRADPWSGRNHKNGIPFEDSHAVLKTVQDFVVQNSRLGIPAFFSEECNHGHQGLDSVIYPTNIGRGSSWNLDLQQDVFRSISEEAQLKGIHLGLLSLFDVLKDPRWGRSEECFGEDPYHISRFSEYAINGFNSDRTTVIGKHFCAQGAAEGGHNAGPAKIGYREMLEVHSYAVEHCLHVTNLKGLMAAYNEIDGLPCHGNQWLLTTYLRDTLGFHGIVMADGTGIDRLNKMTSNPVESARLALSAGVDMSLWDHSYELLESAIEKYPNLNQSLNQAVRHILQLKFELGLFEQSEQSFEIQRQELTKRREVWLEVAKKSADESMVLLKNNGILPLNRNNWKRIVVIGPNGDNLYALLGDYISEQKEGTGKTIFEAIRAKFTSNTDVSYQKGCDIFQEELTEIDFSLKSLETADLIITVLGGSSERNFDMQFMGNGAVTSRGYNMDSGENVDVGDIRLSDSQRDLFEKITKLGKPIVSVLIQGRPYVIEDIVENSDAVLIGWYPGIRGAESVADILVGDVNPSGKLSTTIPANSYQLPVYYNYRNSNAKKNYIDYSGQPEFSFGYGLSYSKFVYHDLEISTKKISRKSLKKGEEILISLKVSNESDISGKEVVQLYINRKSGSIVPRVRELKGFKKIEILGKSTKTVSLTIGYETLKTVTSDYQRDIEETEVLLIIGTGNESYLSETIIITN